MSLNNENNLPSLEELEQSSITENSDVSNNFIDLGDEIENAFANDIDAEQSSISISDSISNNIIDLGDDIEGVFANELNDEQSLEDLLALIQPINLAHQLGLAADSHLSVNTTNESMSFNTISSIEQNSSIVSYQSMYSFFGAQNGDVSSVIEDNLESTANSVVSYLEL